MGKEWTVTDFISLGSKITADSDCSHEIKRCSLLGRKANVDSILKSRDITLLTKVCLVNYDFSSSHVWMAVLDHKESWAPKNWCFWTVMLEKTLESPSDWKEIQTVNPKWNQPWLFNGRNDAESEAPIFWPHDAKIHSPPAPPLYGFLSVLSLATSDYLGGGGLDGSGTQHLQTSVMPPQKPLCIYSSCVSRLWRLALPAPEIRAWSLGP